MNEARQTLAASRFLTPSNLLSISRALLAIPFALVMLSSVPYARIWGCVIIAVAALTDNLDGALARKYNDITEWGKILDPLADKVGVAVVSVVLLELGDIPLWYVAALLGRDLLIFAGGLVVKTRYGIVPASNRIGKWTIGIISLALFGGIVRAGSPWEDILIVASTAMLALSLGAYVMRFVEIVRSQREATYGNT